MIWKIVALAIVLLAAWAFLFRPARKVRRGPPPAPMRAHDLIKCPKCGIYLPSDKPCDCTKRV